MSLERARQCIGRPVKHTTHDIKGTVTKVGKNYVLVQVERDGDTIPCDPENLEWDSHPFAPVVEALRTGTDYEGAQIEVTHDHYMNEYIFIGTPPGANDDNEAHMLYVGMPMMRRFHPVRPTADPWAAYFFEEVCGWAQP